MTKEYVLRNRTAAYQLVLKPKAVAMSLPVLSDDQHLDHYKPLLNRQTPELFILTLRKGRVWGAHGAIITDEDVFLSDLSRESGKMTKPEDHAIYNVLFLKKATEYNGTVASITTAFANVYYHWMLDSIPRLLMLKEQNLFDEIDYFVIDFTGLPFQRQTLEWLGVPESKIIASTDNWNFHLQAEKLIAPSLVSDIDQSNPYEMQLLRKYFLPAISKAKRWPPRFYISRASASARNVINEKELLKFLGSHGFVELQMESLSVFEQIALFNQAEMIVGPHGSAFANIVFCKENALLIDILPETNLATCFYNMATQLGMRYLGFIAEAVPQDSIHRHDNIIVDLNVFESFFRTHALNLPAA